VVGWRLGALRALTISTCPSTSVAETSPFALSISYVCTSLHSKCTADSATRGGFTRSDGRRVSPDSSNSSVPRGNEPQQWLAA
jgi:hypothetical protein